MKKNKQKNTPKCKICGKNEDVIKDGYPKHYCKACKKYFTVHKKPTKNERIILALFEKLLTGASLEELKIEDLAKPTENISDDFVYIKSIERLGNLGHQFTTILEKDYINNCIFLYKSGDKIKVVRRPQKYGKLNFENYLIQFLEKHSRDSVNAYPL